MQKPVQEFFKNFIQFKGTLAKFTLEYPILSRMKLTL